MIHLLGEPKKGAGQHRIDNSKCEVCGPLGLKKKMSGFHAPVLPRAKKKKNQQV